jgi:hypothetical protein
MKISILRQTQESDFSSQIVDLQNFAVRSTHTPADDSDLVNKLYVDSLSQGIDSKESVRVATTAADGNIDLATGGLLTVDGVTVAAGDRVLVKNQTNPAENGIYEAAAGNWVRTDDMDGTPPESVSGGAFTFVEQGTQNANSGWVLQGNGVLSLGVDNLDWTQFSGAGAVVAGDGLDKTGNQLDVDVDDLVGFGIENDGSNNFRISSAAAGSGLTGGGGSALNVQEDTVGGANLARAINVSINGVAIDVDGSSIGENGSNQLEVVDDGITAAKIDTVTEVSAGTDGFVLSWDNGAGRMDWVNVNSLANDYAVAQEELTYGAANDIVAGTPYGLANDIADSSNIQVYQNGILLQVAEYTVNVSGSPDTVTLNNLPSNEFSDGDIITIVYLRLN